MSDEAAQIQQLVGIFEMAGPELVGTKSAFIALFSANLYDHILTLPDEIEHIWKRKFTLVTFLFFLNRYYALLVFCVALAGFFSPLFTPEVCNRFAPFYPFAAGVPLTYFPSIVVGLRVYALYQKNKIVGAILVIYLTAELGVALWVYGTPGSHPLQLPPGGEGIEALHLCIDETADKLGNVKSAAFLFMQTVYDTAVFILIVARVLVQARAKEIRGQRSLQSFIAAQGVVYYFVIFTANLLWALMVILAPPGLKYSTAIPTLILVCTMVNRMTIDLRIEGSRNRNSEFYGNPPDIPMSRLVFGGKHKPRNSKTSTHLLSISEGTSSGTESQERSVVV